MQIRDALLFTNAQVTKQLSPRFTPSPQAIKHSIDALLEKEEYMQRMQGDRSVYEYLA